jgi:hypothetical protein
MHPAPQTGKRCPFFRHDSFLGKGEGGKSDQRHGGACGGYDKVQSNFSEMRALGMAMSVVDAGDVHAQTG